LAGQIFNRVVHDANSINWNKSSETRAKIYAKIIRNDYVIAEAPPPTRWLATTPYSKRKRIQIFIIARKRI